MKAFIQEAYNDLRWFDANGQAASAAPVPQRTATMQPPTRAPSQTSAPPVVHAKSAPPPSGTGDLFGAFDDARGRLQRLGQLRVRPCLRELRWLRQQRLLLQIGRAHV